MIDAIGYTALMLNLVSMSMKNLLHLRIISLGANIIYILYSILISATPMIIGSVIAILLHGYGILRILRQKTDNQGREYL
jgi:hypothetical protein